MSDTVRISRRNWLGLSSVGAVGMSRSGWLQALAADAAVHPKRHKSVILLWMNGGPATIDMWDLKPGHANGGPSKEIETAAAGVRISENLPKIAKHMKDVSVIRSMATREGDHRRARIVSLTGYTPVGAIQFPALGALVAHEFHDPKADLPGFVSIGRSNEELGGGFLGPRFSPFVVGGEVGRRAGNPALTGELKVQDLEVPEGLSTAAYSKRLDLLAGLENDFEAGKGSPVAETMKAATDRAVRLMRPEAANAFRLEDEKEALRDSYGRTTFGQGCLLARRLVERGVAFVEVTLDGWDTHQNNFDRVRTLSGSLDGAFSALLADLKDRGMLDSTLVVCQGEFGRTPKINGQSGRDHWPASWSAVLAGGGIKGGLAVGKTSADGTAVESEPTRTPDLVATVVKAIGIDPMKQNMSNVSRPIRIADPVAKPVKEPSVKRILFGLSILASFGVCLAAEPAPAKKSGVPLELVLLGEQKLARIEVLVEVDGTSISAIWNDTFAKLFAYFDRNGDGSLDAKEVSVLPSARSLRQAMGNGFTPPAGLAPELSELDLNGDGKVAADELAVHYRSAGIGNAQIGVGRLPLSAELTSALIKYLDTDADGSVSEKEWKDAPESFRKLDKNEDELIGAGELVPRIFYPSAAGTNLLSPPAEGTDPYELIAKLPLIVLPADAKNAQWAKEIARRNPHFKADDLAGWRTKESDAKWLIKLSEKGNSEGFVFGGDRIRVEGWAANGRLGESLAAARKQIAAQLDAPPEPKEQGTERRRPGGLGWLLSIADRNSDGDLDSKELDAWFDLQTQIGRGQVLITVLDNGGLFESLDANHDGALSIRELRTAWHRMKDTDTKNPARLLLVAASHGYPRTLTTSVSRGPAWFQAMDKNGDGDVSRREFTGQADVFDQLDVDKDGLLNAEEAEKAGAIVPKK